MKINLGIYYQLAEFKTSERLEMRGYTVLEAGTKPNLKQKNQWSFTVR
ncbi:hypothetical protein [Veillonella sp.]|nr:hypothetical protein [Veillonella sp.]